MTQDGSNGEEQQNRYETVLIWRKGAGSPNIQGLQQVLKDCRAASRRGRKAKKSFGR